MLVKKKSASPAEEGDSKNVRVPAKAYYSLVVMQTDRFTKTGKRPTLGDLITEMVERQKQQTTAT